MGGFEKTVDAEHPVFSSSSICAEFICSIALAFGFNTLLDGRGGQNERAFLIVFYPTCSILQMRLKAMKAVGLVEASCDLIFNAIMALDETRYE